MNCMVVESGGDRVVIDCGLMFPNAEQALGVEDFGQSGARADLYRHYGIDAAAIVAAARTLLAL